MIEGTRRLYPAEAVAAARIACIVSIDRIGLISKVLDKKEERGHSHFRGRLEWPLQGETSEENRV
jgi:hypothetical protein